MTKMMFVCFITVGVNRNGTLLFVNYTASDASMSKIKRKSCGFQNTSNLHQYDGTGAKLWHFKENKSFSKSCCETLYVLANYLAKDASIFKISVPIIKWRSWGFQSTPNLLNLMDLRPSYGHSKNALCWANWWFSCILNSRVPFLTPSL